MKTLKITGALVLLSVLTMSFYSFETTNKNNQITHISADSVLRHVVLFKFKDGTAPEDIKKVEDAFSALPSKIPEIKGYEWGINNSPESLNKGLTHCFFLTFENEEDRGIYLPHPDHKAFGEVLGPHLDDVLVLDYWTK
ncbi:Dabb family protein [Maribacter sp. MJ134]|uniref:Dabb family protein n=1 Tax=Maribacter sp. MJ134 TaxID=2496865 RepID=UPI000F81E2EF|nr:Dabb family protein [Maribacter sp. MJ134]AZQ58772.1 Dabb family protein [Maribacter sp. MJ134]